MTSSNTDPHITQALKEVKKFLKTKPTDQGLLLYLKKSFEGVYAIGINGILLHFSGACECYEGDEEEDPEFLTRHIPDSLLTPEKREELEKLGRMFGKEEEE